MSRLLAAAFLLGSTACNAILSIPDHVELLCESGEECPGGFCGETFTCDPQQWAIALGGADEQHVHDVAWYDPDREGEQPGLLLLAGSFRGELVLSPELRFTSMGDTDAYVVALDSTGATVWAQHFGGPGEQRASAIAVGDDGATFVTGPLGGTTGFGALTLTTSPDVADGFLARLNFDDGAVLWAERFGGTDQLSVEDLAVVGESTAVVGSFQGPFRSGPPGAINVGARDSGYIVSFNGTNTNSISSSFGSTGNLRACCALVDPLTGALMLGGDFDGDLSVGQGTLQGTEASGYILVLADPGPEGSEVSLIGLGQPLDAFGTDSLGRLAIGMTTSTEPGVGVYRILANQVTEAVRAVSPTGSARLVALTNNRDNATLALGRFSDGLDVVEGPSFEAEEQDLFVLTIDEDWRIPPGRSRAFGGVGRVIPAGIEADDEGHVMIAGTFDGTLTLDNDAGAVTLHSTGGTDVFVAQLRL